VHGVPPFRPQRPPLRAARLHRPHKHCPHQHRPYQRPRPVSSSPATPPLPPPPSRGCPCTHCSRRPWQPWPRGFSSAPKETCCSRSLGRTTLQCRTSVCSSTVPSAAVKRPVSSK